MSATRPIVTRVLTGVTLAVLFALTLFWAVPQRAVAESGDAQLQVAAGSLGVGQGASLQAQSQGELELVSLSGDSVTGSASSGYTIYVRDGDSVEFTLTFKNNSGGTLEYVNVASSSTYTADGQEVSPFHFPAYRFATGYSTSDYDGAATNATWGEGSELVSSTTGYVYSGYTVAAGATASVIMDIDAGSLPTGTYTYSFTLGKKGVAYEAVTYPGGYTNWEATGEGTVLAEYLTVPVKVVVYAQDGAALSVGTGSPISLTTFTQATPYDFGTFNLSSSGLSGTTTFYAVNAGTANETTDSHGNTTSISATLELDDAALGTTPFSYVGTQTYARQDLGVKRTSGSSTSIDSLQFQVYYDASQFIAGTYTGNLVVTTVPRSVKVNGGAASSTGTCTLPITITLKGHNSRLDDRVTDLAATAGNGLVELTWTPASTASSGTYLVYRREGTETATDPDALDWSAYTQVGSVNVSGNSSITFADGTAQNGMKYTYTVLTGGPYKGYAATPVAATPSTSAQVKLLAPMDGWNDYVGVSGDEGGVNVSWNMNGAYGGEACDGAGMVDHFNVYRDGVLVRQVYQSAVGRTGEGTDGDPYEYGWSTFVSVPELYVDYKWKVSAVSPTGVEGYLSEDAPYGEDKAHGFASEKPVIIGHSASYYSGDGVDVHLDFWDGENHNMKSTMFVSGDTLTVWRTIGTSAPNTSAAPYATTTTPSDSVTYTDTGVSANKTYTYTMRITDQYGNVSDDYTFSVYTKNGRSYDSTVDWSVADGTTPTLSFCVPDSGAVARVYRNNTLVKTLSYNSGDYQTYSDTSKADGTYTYRVDFYYATGDITLAGRTYTFKRNSKAEANMLKPPAAPTLTGRLSGEDVVLTWTPAASGGAADGYYVYRKDAGEFVQGTYRYQSGWQGYWYTGQWGNDRYLVIKDPATCVLVDTQESRNYNGVDATDGYLPGISWWDSYEEAAIAHEWYLCAYNEAGVSEPSQVVGFQALGVDEYNNAMLPSNVDELAPGTPVIDKLWVDWQDDSTVDGWDELVGGHVRVAWSDPNPGGSIDSWAIAVKGTVYHQAEAVESTVGSAEALVDPSVKAGSKDFDGSSVTALPKSNSGGDYERTVEVTVTARNGAGASNAAASSLVVRSLPRFYAMAGNAKAVLRWTDLFEDTTTKVSSWEIWRKDPYGAWARVTTLTSPAYANAGSSDSVMHYEYTDDGLMNGYTYEYRVVAVCDDGIDRPSVDREVTPAATAATEAPGAPTNLSESVVNGSVIFTWDVPTTGEAPQYYQVQYEYSTDSWAAAGDAVSGTSTSAVWNPYQAGTYTCRVKAYSYVGGSIYNEQDAYSGTIQVTVTSEQLKDRNSLSAPSAPSVTATPGEGQVTLSWPAVSDATLYKVARYTNSSLSAGYASLATLATVSGQSTYTYVDATAEPGVRYWYTVTASNTGDSPYYAKVEAVATGTTRDQVAAATVAALIEALPEKASVTADDEANIQTVQEAYDNLTDKQKSYVGSDVEQKLEDACAALAICKYQDQIDPVQAMIDADNFPTPEAIGEADEAQLDACAAKAEAARAAFDALPDEAKAGVDVTKLEAAEQAIAAARKVLADKAAAAEVDSLITALPDADLLSLDDRAAVEAARVAYGTLTADQQQCVTNLAYLEAAEAQLAALQKEVDDRAVAQPVAEAISNLPDAGSLTLEQASAVAAAREALDALTVDQRAYVSDKLQAKLVAAEQCIEALSKEAEDAQAAAAVSDLLADISDSSQISLDDADAVEAALAAYGALTDDQKALVDASAVTRVQDALARVEALRKGAAKTARVDIAKGAVKLSATTFTYDGKAKKPTVTLVVAGKTLKLGTDFTVGYSGNVNAGTNAAKVTISGIGAYKGTKTASFTINKAANTLTAKAKSKLLKVKAKKLAKKKQTIKRAKAFVVKNAKGTVTFQKLSGNKKITVSKKGVITLKKKLKKSLYKVKVRVTAAGTANYAKATKTVTLKIRVK